MYSEFFEKALKNTLSIEGGYVNNANDSGGATNYGISLKTYKKVYPKATVDTIKALTINEATDFYHKYFWLPQYDEIKSEDFALKIFDAAVNMGHHQAHLCLQQALNCVGHSIKEDGILGKNTLKALNSSDQPYWSYAILCAYCSELAGHYRVSVAKYPKNKEFEKGWLKRAYSKW